MIPFSPLRDSYIYTMGDHVDGELGCTPARAGPPTDAECASRGKGDTP